jgi:flavin-dependent dehydrogenase
MWDVVIAGAGPAGSVTATILARAGARVLLLDRARFPRDKLCGDSINPGTLGVLHRWNLASRIEQHGLPIEGMVLYGSAGVEIEAKYPGVTGRTVIRRDLDQWLLDHAIAAGAQFEERTTVQRALVSSPKTGSTFGRVSGVVVKSAARGGIAVSARVTIAADGRRSKLAFDLGLATYPLRPRRWAVGAYAEQSGGTRTMGEMHIGAGQYIGVAPLPGGLTNICVVGEPRALGHLSDPERVLRTAIYRDSTLRDRFTDARFVTRPVVLGPLAVDTRSAGVTGLLLVGDAAGFVDPMTGDGLRFAVRGAELAADATIEMLATGDMRGHVELEHRRHAEFAPKWRFDRALRRLIDSRTALRIATFGAAVAPAYVQALVAFAGDCDRLEKQSRDGNDRCHVDRGAAASPHAGGRQDVHAAGV